jgi:ferritin-like metal-binding protein YciE
MQWFLKLKRYYRAAGRMEPEPDIERSLNESAPPPNHGGRFWCTEHEHRELPMPTSSDDTFMSWLRDAHAMEEQAEQVLSSLARRIENYPELKSQIERHLEVTRHQAVRIRGCIERRNGSPSAIKSTVARMLGVAQGLSGLFVGDEVVKGVLATYTFEHMEIASYRILIAAADKIGDAETKRVLEEIVREEEEMAKWLGAHFNSVTLQFLEREETPHATAKH